MNAPRIIGFEASRENETLDASNSEQLLSAIRWLLLLTTVLVVFGLMMLYSASYGQAGLTYFKKQLLWVVLGIFGAAAAFFVGYRKLAASAPLWMGLCFVALLIAKFCFAPVNGASRWLRLPGGVTIQPSEFAKVAVLLFIAHYCSEHQRTFSNLRGRGGLLPLILPVGAVIGGILLGKDLGTTVLAILAASLALFAAGLYLRYMVLPMGFFVLAGVFVYFYDPTRMARVTSFLHPEEVQSGEGYQLYTSLMALGSGKWFGIGFMASRMKAKYLPEAHTDFILSVIGEELGFVTMAALIIIYSLWGFFALRIALNSNSRIGAVLGFALTCSITLQAAINIAVVSGSIPTKGMPAPFISCGGSNMIASLIAVGLLLSIAVDALEPGYTERLSKQFKSILHIGKQRPDENN